MTPAVLRRAAPLAVAVVVLVLVLGVIRLIDPPGEGVGGSGSGSGGEPGVLRLAQWTPPGDASPDPRYTLAVDRADLPDGPGEAPVHELRGAESGRAERLATALGLGGEPVRERGVRVWRSPTALLTVETGHGAAWSYALILEDGAVGSGGTVSADGTVSAGGGDDPAVAGQTTRDQAVTITRALLADAGIEAGRLRAGPAGPSVLVTGAPTVAGLPSTGTSVTVVVSGSEVVSAQGSLATTEEGTSYPLVTAARAWDDLVRTPLPMPLIACPEQLPSGQDPVACGGPVTVTGAELGLSLQWSETGPLLVPSWLFEVEGSPDPLARIAVDPRYVEPADPPGVPDAPTSAPGGGVPGSTGTAVPPATPSTAPSTEPGPDDPMSRFISVTRGADGRSLDVTFWGGVEDCYAYTVRAEESADVVALSLSERSTFEGACIDMAQEYDRTVRLEQPLGVRRVVDAATGDVLLRRTR